MEENNEKKGNTAALAEDPVFRHFLGICRIPHPSFKEKALSDAILAWAEARRIPCRQDKFHNLYLRKKASPGREQEPGFLLQAHLDMVCQKAPHVTHDFDKDPIRTVQEGDLVTTGGKTTLGADDGIGVALAMALQKMTSAVRSMPISAGSIPGASSIWTMPRRRMRRRAVPAAAASAANVP